MADDRSRTLPATANLVKPPLLARSVLRSFNDFAEGELVLRFANGAERSMRAARSGARAIMEIERVRAFRRALVGGTVGLAEAYLDGDWTSPDLAGVFEFGARNLDRLMGGMKGLAPLRLLHLARHKLRVNTRRGAQRNIAAHYDLGNDFYSQWLDPTMTYSSAFFEGETMSLEEAQRNKWRRLAEMLELQAGHHILEIGCGWGGFAMYAAREFGCLVTGITLSKAQHAYARTEVARHQLSHLVDIQLIDYRDVQGTFDRIVSIEMFEAVGEENWPSYFAAVRDRLKPGGSAGLQIITIEDERFDDYRKDADFIQLYIFPGGMLPSPTALRTHATSHGLGFETVRTFALSYAETLRRWRDSFDSRWQRIAPLGFDERFKRMWDYYLASCEGGFRAGAIDVGQFKLTRA
ncbi:MAG TPA: cyclopropane-fatty-acyl-phospholipid synthase family protein [Rhizomicrobium sp.]|jgi:cyclopropane-fatty-acyl-phospholipid synthase